MKVHKVTLTIVDFDELGSDQIVNVLQNTKYPNHCISPKVIKIETKDIGAWDDEHPLNKADTYMEYLSRLFAK